MAVLYDVCIVGAGVSGASLAAYLSANNLNIALVDYCFEERDRIVGELLQPGGVFMLKKLGLDSVLDEISSCEVNGYALYNKDAHIVIDYSNDGDFENIKGRGLNNGKFIQALRKKSFNKENVACIQGRATGFIEEENHVEGIIYEDESKEKQVILAKLTIVCDGFFSKLRSQLIEEDKTITSHFAGLILEKCILPQENYGHIFMGAKAPFLCYRINKDEIRLLVDFPGSDAPLKGLELNQYLLFEIMPQLPLSMQKSLKKAIKKGKYKFMPNHLMKAVPCTKKGVVLIGDSLNMRHPLTGGGMTAALTDVMLLSKAIIQDKTLHNTNTLQTNIYQYYEDRKEWNASINILADALYKVTLNEELKNACFNYLAKGENNCKQPIDLLSGISRDNSILFKHFVQVAILGAKDNIFKQFGMKGLDNSFNMLVNASQILFPLILNEKIQIKNFTSSKSISKLASAS